VKGFENEQQVLSLHFSEQVDDLLLGNFGWIVQDLQGIFELQEVERESFPSEGLVLDLPFLEEADDKLSSSSLSYSSLVSCSQLPKVAVQIGFVFHEPEKIELRLFSA